MYAPSSSTSWKVSRATATLFHSSARSLTGKSYPLRSTARPASRASPLSRAELAATRLTRSPGRSGGGRRVCGDGRRCRGGVGCAIVGSIVTGLGVLRCGDSAFVVSGRIAAVVVLPAARGLAGLGEVDLGGRLHRSTGLGRAEPFANGGLKARLHRRHVRRQASDALGDTLGDDRFAVDTKFFGDFMHSPVLSCQIPTP